MPTKLDEAYYEVTLRETKAIEGAKRVEDALGKKIPEGGKIAEKEINLAFGKMGEAGEVATHSIEHAFGHLGKMFAAGGLFGLAVGEGTHLLMENGRAKCCAIPGGGGEDRGERRQGRRSHAQSLPGTWSSSAKSAICWHREASTKKARFGNSGVAPELAAKLQKPIDRIAGELERQVRPRRQRRGRIRFDGRT